MLRGAPKIRGMGSARWRRGSTAFAHHSDSHGDSVRRATLWPCAASFPWYIGNVVFTNRSAGWAMSRSVSLAAVLLAVAVPPVLAQGSHPADLTVDAATRREVIGGVRAGLREADVLPDTAVAMERAIRDRVRRGEYERITSAQTLADSLTAHLQAVSQDRHLRVRYSDEPLPRLDAQQRPTPQMEARARAFGRQVNFGFEKVERLPGNVGYLELRSFGFEAEWIGDAAAAAVAFLANTDALIVDVRRNGGGAPGLGAVVAGRPLCAGPGALDSALSRPRNPP